MSSVKSYRIGVPSLLGCTNDYSSDKMENGKGICYRYSSLRCAVLLFEKLSVQAEARTARSGLRFKALV